MDKIKAVALISGGLDSILASAIIKKQGIDVRAFHFVSIFAGNPKKVREFTNKLKIPLKIQKADSRYYKIIKSPKHNYGKNINPCIDCRIHILKRAKEYADKIGAKFIITGEVVGQRPMSQHKKAMKIVEKQSGLEGYLVRPLSAKLLDKTIPEKKKWINRSKLFDIQGRSRKRQLELAKKYGITNEYYASGGCRLTDSNFAKRLRDLINYNQYNIKNIQFLCYGRHFRIDNNKIIVGRNEKENNMLKKLKGKKDLIFEVKNIGSPITLLIGTPNPQAVKLAAQLTARYSDSKSKKTIVHYGSNKISVSRIKDFEKYII